MHVQVMYSEFLTLVNTRNVQSVGIDDSTDKIYFTLAGHSAEQAPAEAAASMVASTSAAVDSGKHHVAQPQLHWS